MKYDFKIIRETDEEIEFVYKEIDFSKIKNWIGGILDGKIRSESEGSSGERK